MFEFYTRLSRTTRLRIGIVGLVVGSVGLYLDSRVDEHRNDTVKEKLAKEQEAGVRERD
jgi:hypothetical protein